MLFACSLISEQKYTECCCCFIATNPELKKSAKADHGFKVTSDGRLIIKEDEDEDVKDKGKWDLVLICTLLNVWSDSDSNYTCLTDGGEMEDILEEAGVKSVSI